MYLQTQRQSHQSQQNPRRSVIRANGWFERTVLPTDNTICVFRYLNSYPERPLRPVESRFCGLIRRELQPQYEATQYPWYLNVRSLLHLNHVSSDDSAQYMREHCVRYGVPEYGRHLFVDCDGFLCGIDIWKSFRGTPLVVSDVYTINDVLPRIRLEFVGRHDATYPVIDTLYVLNIRGGSAYVMDSTRWWHRRGRDSDPRFQEYTSPISHDRPLLGDGFGLYVDDRARLIMRDQCGPNQFNYTLIQSGVFIIVETKFRITFMNNYGTECAEVLPKPYYRIPENPIIVLQAVPSLGESICWGLTISWNEMRAVLNVPLLGMNENRMRIYDWNRGYRYVSVRQRHHNFRQFCSFNRRVVIPSQDIRCAHYVLNEPLEYPSLYRT